MAKAKTQTEGLSFTVFQGEFLARLLDLSGIVKGKTTIPVLSNILVEVRDGRVFLSATDLDLSLQTSASIGLISSEGSACLHANKLTQIVQSLPKGAEIEFRVGDTQCEMRSGKSKFKMPWLAKEDFPEIKETDQEGIELSGSLWKSLVDRTVYCVTAEESRYALQGSKMVIGNKLLKLVTTDGHRLAYLETEISSDLVADVLIPKKALVESAKLVDGVESFEFIITPELLSWKVGDTVLSSKTLSGQFPNYELVLPKENHCVCVVDRDKLIASLKRVSLMADEKAHGVKLEFIDNVINLSAATSEAGEALDSVEAKYDSDPITVGFNSYYLIDALNAIETQDVKVMLKDGSSQVEVGPEGESVGIARHIAMPMRA